VAAGRSAWEHRRSAIRANVGDAPDIDRLWDFGDPAASEARFRALAPSLVDRPEPAAELLTQIARAQGLQRRFEEAAATLDRVAVALEPGGPPRLRARYLLERGRLENSAGRPELASPRFAEAFDVAEAAGEDALAVDAAHMLGISEPPGPALAWTLRALELAERSEQPAARAWRASLLNNIGWARHDAGEHEAALGCFERALALRRASGTEEDVRVARWCVARERRALGDACGALAEQRALAAELEAAGERDGYVLEEVGECLLALGCEDEARPWLARAHALLAADPWLAEREPERLERLRRIGSGA
jgi:tetratricopeptide (TPR) repeat protein